MIIESSIFGSEVVAMRTCLELVKEILYKLITMGVLINEPEIVFGDNKSVVNGTSTPQSKLSKKHIGICYHYIR